MSTKPVSSKTCKGECMQPVVIDGNDDEELCVDTPEVKKDLILYNETDPRQLTVRWSCVSISA